ncbi:MAG: VWA domain-containing protein [Planctomycetota bacterium]|nr:MAG: VWA domain-containing protein [Planctomycetota bacterium]
MLSRAHGLLLGMLRRKGSTRRKGAILVLSAICMVFLMGLLAFAIDLGYIMTVQTELKRATDAAALAGASQLVQGQDAAQIEAFEFLARNPVATVNLAEDPNFEQNLQLLLAQHENEFEAEAGVWDTETRTFSTGSAYPSALRVTAVHNNAPLFFAKVFGLDTFNVQAESIARFQPRDIVLVLDFSASMNDDSELRRIYEYGESVRETIEANLLQIYQELGSPTYGSLPFEPEYFTQVGQPPTAPNLPQITVTFKDREIYVTSTKDLSNVVIEYTDGSRQKFDGLSGTTGTFRGTGAYSNKKIKRCWVKSGANSSGEGPGYGERFEDTTENIMAAYGLDSVPYPYPSGSWSSYINYVKNGYYIKKAGYRKQYGMMTLINYWLEQKPEYSQTPDLWMVSEQPVKQLKDAVGLFFDFIQEVNTNDRVGLVVYNSEDQTALIEHHLTDNFSLVEDTVTHRQAGHYDRYTNIGAGLSDAIDELLANARPGAFKMIVLMTDGRANRPYSSSYARSYVLNQAQRAADNHFPIFAISMGLGADHSLMADVAEISEGRHFPITGGATVNDYSDDLIQAFREIADHRPLVLVK